jgi:hypothetical protein
MNEIEKNFSTCHRFELFTGDRSERNLYLYQKLGYKIFKTANLTDQTTIVYLEKKIEAVSENEERKEIQFRKL